MQILNVMIYNILEIGISFNCWNYQGTFPSSLTTLFCYIQCQRKETLEQKSVIYNYLCFYRYSVWACAQWCPTLCDPWTVARQACLSMSFPGKNTRSGCHFLLHGVLPTQISNPCLLHLLHWQTDYLPLSYLGSPLSSIIVAFKKGKKKKKTVLFYVGLC